MTNQFQLSDEIQYEIFDGGDHEMRYIWDDRIQKMTKLGKPEVYACSTVRAGGSSIMQPIRQLKNTRT